MRRSLSYLGLAVFLVVGGCTWPPRPSVPSTPAPNDVTQQGTESVPRVGTVGVPAVAPPAVSLPRSGGLLGR